jgi:hypothetical protein
MTTYEISENVPFYFPASDEERLPLILLGIMVFNGLPVVAVDDDFLEYLQEEGVDSSLELIEFIEYWDTWSRKNLT